MDLKPYIKEYVKQGSMIRQFQLKKIAKELVIEVNWYTP